MSTALKFFILIVCCASVVPQNSTKCAFGNNIDEFVQCMTIRALRTIDQVQNQETLEIVPGVILKRNTSLQRTPKEIHFDQNIKSSKILEMFASSTARFFSDRVLKIEVPLNMSDGMSRALEEGRGKMKKMMGTFLLGLGTKMMTMVPVMFGVVLLLTSKALIVGKLALVLAGVLFIQLFSSGRLFTYGGTFNIPPTYGVPNYNTNYGTNTLGGGWSTAGQYP